jgi:GNAT superfamily N-acetyltransferase
MINNPLIRPALPSEQKALEALHWHASLANPGDRESLVANPDAIQLPLEQIAAGQVFVAERDGAIAGFAALLPREDGDAELDALFVEPTCQRHGIGRSLVEHCFEVARARGAGALHVIGNPHAEAFYRALNFQMSGTVETRFGVGWALRRNL